MKRFYLFMGLLLLGSTMSVKADIDRAGDYFKVYDRALSCSRNYIEFEYADYDFKGVDDAFKDIEFILNLKDGTSNIVGRMWQQHDNLGCWETHLGALSVVGTTGEHPRIVTMRYYPTEVSFGNIKSFGLKGRWDIDNDNGSDDYTVNETRSVSTCNSAFIDAPDFASYDFVRKTSYSVDVIAASKITPYNEFEQKLYYSSTPDGFRDKLTLTSTDQKNFRGSLKYLSVNAENQNTVLIRLTVEKWFGVKNGSVGKDKSVTNIQQRFYGPIKTTTLRSYPFPTNLRGTRDAETKKVTLTWDYSNSGFQNENIQVYRRKASSNFVSDRVKIGEVSSAYTSFTEPQLEEDPLDDYIYEVFVCPSSWEYFEERLSSETTVAKMYNWEGLGYSNNPYRIKNDEQLRMLEDYTAKGYVTEKKYWKQTADIDLGGEARPWKPIGNVDNTFKGNYNGDGFVISNLYMNINTDHPEYSGLFGSVNGGGTSVIENMYLMGVSIKNISGGFGGMGGLLGDAQNTTIRNCFVNGTFQGERQVGGISGLATSATFENCSFIGTLSAVDRGNVGGIVGSTNNVIVRNCFASFSYNPQNLLVGSMIGMGWYDVTISNCYYETTPLESEIPAVGQKPSVSNIIEADATGLADLRGTALVGQLGIDNWNYRSLRYPRQKVFDKDNAFDVTLKSGETVNDIVAEVPNASVRCVLDGDSKYSVIMLPYALTAEQIANMGKFYNYCGFHYGEGNYLAFFQEVAATEANKAYLFERGGVQTFSQGYNLDVDNVTLNPTDKLANPAVAPATDGLFGSYKNISIPDGGYRFVNELDAVNEFGKFEKVSAVDNSLLPMNAYFWKTYIPEDINSIDIMLFDGTSGVPEMNAENIEKAKGIFNMNGQKLSAPQDGVNIINGVKVMKWR